MRKLNLALRRLRAAGRLLIAMCAAVTLVAILAGCRHDRSEVAGTDAAVADATANTAADSAQVANSVASVSGDATRGKQIYLTGVSSLGTAVTTLLGDSQSSVPAAVLKCANCHGHDGRGRPEGGIFPSNVTWQELTKPYRQTRTGREERPPYAETSLKRAITMGIGPAGRELDAAMPRYRMTHQDLADLVAYLRVIGDDFDAGLTENEIRVGTVLAPQQLGDMGRAVRAALTAYFADINQSGGVYGRQLTLRVIDARDSPYETATAVREFLDSEKIFALTAVFMAGHDAEIAAIADEQGVPVVGAFSLDPQLGFPLKRELFYLDAGLPAQGRTLASFAAQQFAGRDANVAIVYPDRGNLPDLAAMIADECGRAGLGTVRKIDLGRQPQDFADLAQTLGDGQTQVVFFLGANGAEREFFSAVAALEGPPSIFVPSPLASADLFAAPVNLDGRIFMSFPSLPAAETPDAAARYRQLAEKYGLQGSHLGAQLSALSSATILVEGLKRAGANVSRSTLIDAVEGLNDFSPGFTRPVTYGPNRRVGTRGYYVIAVDLKGQRVAPKSQWIETSPAEDSGGY